MAQKGSLTLLDLKAERVQSVAEFGLDTMNEVIQRDLATHNAIVADAFGDICEITKDRQRISGGSDVGEMTPVDEIGTAPTQKVGLNGTVGFPLEAFQYNLGWSELWFELHTVGDMAEQVLNGQKAHKKRLVRDMKQAMYNSQNVTFPDRRMAPVLNLDVRRFVNADSQPIADGPFGETFTAASHTHYIGEASLAVADVLLLIANVREHGHGEDLVLAIHADDEAAVAALSGFRAYNEHPSVIPSDSSVRTNVTINFRQQNNRAIGRLGGAEVWVKPWAIDNYIVCFDRADGNKPLCLRTRDGKGPTLKVVAKFAAYPLHAEFMAAEHGFGVWTRTNGAVLYTANATYADPSIVS